MFICITTTYANGDSLTVTTDRHQAPIAKTYTKTDRVIYEDTEAEYGSETMVPGYTETLVTNEYDELGKLTKAIDNCSDVVYNKIIPTTSLTEAISSRRLPMVILSGTTTVTAVSLDSDTTEADSTTRRTCRVTSLASMMRTATSFASTPTMPGATVR